MTTFTIGVAMFALQQNPYARVARLKLDSAGNSHWRRTLSLWRGEIFETWPSGHRCLYIPTQEDLLATDWTLLEQ